jgi:hypothetical protein
VLCSKHLQRAQRLGIRLDTRGRIIYQGPWCSSDQEAAKAGKQAGKHLGDALLKLFRRKRKPPRPLLGPF